MWRRGKDGDKNQSAIPFPTGPPSSVPTSLGEGSRFLYGISVSVVACLIPPTPTTHDQGRATEQRPFADRYTHVFTQIPKVGGHIDGECVVGAYRDEKHQQHHLSGGCREERPYKRNSERASGVGYTSCSYH